MIKAPGCDIGKEGHELDWEEKKIDQLVIVDLGQLKDYAVTGKCRIQCQRLPNIFKGESYLAM